MSEPALAPSRLVPVVLLLLASAAAQNRDHPGLVSLGDGKWGTPAEAEAAGLIEYHGRFLPKRLSAKLARWEKLDAKGLEWENAYRTASKHYRLTTNVPRFVVELEIKPFLDALFDTYVKVFREDFRLKGKAADKKFVKIYHGFEDYRKFEHRTRGTPGFIINGDELVVFYEETDPAMFYGTVFHEGAHQFFHAMLPGADLPHWLNEGLATYFEGCVYSRATQSITIDYFPPVRVQLAQNLLRRTPDATPASMFFDVSADAFTAQHYALSWSFLYYLTHVEDGRYRDGFGRFLRELNGSGARPLADVFKADVGIALDEIGKGWRQYVLGLKAGDPPEWVVLGVTGDCPLHDGDVVWSVGGTEVFGAKQFEEVWQHAKQQPVEVVVVRHDGDLGSMTDTAEFVRATIEPSAGVELRPKAAYSRAHNLVD